MVRHFIYQKGRSEKFWSIEIGADSKFLNTAQGQGRGEAKSEKQAFESEELCQKKIESLVQAKLKEGYEEVLLAIKDVNPFDLKDVADIKKQKGERLSVSVHGSSELLEEICSFDWLKHLELRDLTTLSDSLGNLKNLDHLEIKESRSLESIPESIGKLQTLTWLSIEYTAINSLPHSIGSLSNLKCLNVQHNPKLKGLPESIGSLRSLKTLWINYNRDDHEPRDEKKNLNPFHIPDSIGDLENLMGFNAPKNDLSDLPRPMGRLKKLIKLDLSFNPFITIPECVFEMEDLETLDMAYCNLSEIPEGFAKLANLSRFDFKGSRVKNIPNDVLYAGVETIQKFLNKTPDKKQNKIPVTDSNEFKISLEQHKGSLEKFYRDVKDKMYKDDTRKKLEALRKFFSGEIDEVPKSIAEDHYYFKTLPNVLAPYRKWTVIDFRILAYITQSAWSFKKNKEGFFETFYRWLGREVLNDPEDSQLFSDILNTLKEYGVDETKLLAERKYEIQEIAFTSDHRITSFGRYLLEHFDEIISDFMKESLPSQFVGLFVREKFEKIEPLIAQITKIKEYDSSDGKKHVPHQTIEILCKVKPTLMEPIILDRIEAIDCASCKAELNRILYESFRDKYKQKVVDSAKVTLDYISERKNKNLDRGYDFDWSLSKEFYRDDTSDYIEWLLKNFGSDLKTEIFSYVEKTKVLDLNVVGVAVKYLGQDAVDIAGEALDMTIKDDDIAGHFRQAFNILSNLDYSKYYDKTWEIAKSEFKKVSETACLTLSRLPEKQVAPKALELLNEKQVHVREAGALVLSLLSTPDSVESLKPLIEKEKNDDVRNLAVGVVYKTPVELDVKEAKRRISVAKALGKLDKPLVKWLDESKLPEILWKDQKPLSEEEIRYLFYRQKTVPAIEMDLELRDVVALIDKSGCEKFSKSLLSLILKNGGFKAPNRFAISILGILGSDDVVSEIEAVAKKEMNLNACFCLGFICTINAAGALDRILQMFRVKYPNVREAAQQAFESIADEMSLTSYELRDRVMSDLGFENLFKKVEINKIEYTQKISPDLKFTYYNGDGKEVKTLKMSEVEKKKNKEENTLLKEAVKQFGINLEYYLVVQRSWSSADWREFFLKNPIANAYSQNFIWVHVSENQDAQRFYVVEDKTLDANDRKFELGVKSKIHLLHPLSLDVSERNLWFSKLKEKKIEPPLDQLDRGTYTVSSEEKNEKISYQFQNKEMIGITFKNRAEKYGWRRGSVVDAGEVSSYRKLFPNENVEVFLMLENLNVQNYNMDERITFKEFFFVKQGSITTGSYVYDEPKNEKDHRLISFGNLDPIVYSETLYDLHRILQSKNEE